jgi:hypothetical protein
MERLSSASFPSRSIVALISSFLGVIRHLNGFGLMFNPSLRCCQHPSSLHTDQQYLRIAKYVNWNLVSSLVKSFLDVESPQQSSNADKCPLLSKCLACTHTPSPSKSHISTFVWERSLVWAIFDKSLWVESVRIWEVCFISVDRPNVALRPSILWYQPSLVIICQTAFLESSTLRLTL